MAKQFRFLALNTTMLFFIVAQAASGIRLW
jgi:hypothetical protein